MLWRPYDAILTIFSLFISIKFEFGHFLSCFFAFSDSTLDRKNDGCNLTIDVYAIEAVRRDLDGILTVCFQENLNSITFRYVLLSFGIGRC